jgi:hypothetical protein
VERLPPPRDDRIRAPALRLDTRRVYGGLISEDHGHAAVYFQPAALAGTHPGAVPGLSFG